MAASPSWPLIGYSHPEHLLDPHPLSLPQHLLLHASAFSPLLDRFLLVHTFLQVPASKTPMPSSLADHTFLADRTSLVDHTFLADHTSLADRPFLIGQAHAYCTQGNLHVLAASSHDPNST